jgi:hypothetical protein
VPLAAALALVAYALFAGGGVGDNRLLWLGAFALVAIVASLAVRGIPSGALRLAPLAALAAWCAVTIRWSTLPDRSWDYANRGLVYLLFALLGLWLADRRRELALGLAGLLGAVAAWSLAGKVFPGLNGDFSLNARLSVPVGLWNQLALLGAFAMPIALWLAGRRRVSGTLLAYAWIVVCVLTLSRGGLAVAVLAVVAWLALSGEAEEGIATLVAAVCPAAVVCGVAFALPGVTRSGQAQATRWRDGLIFGAVLLAGAAGAAVLARAPRPAVTPRLRRLGLGVAAVLVAAVVVGGALKAQSAWHQFTSETSVSNSSQRINSLGSNFRWAWWKQGWTAFTVHPAGGTGAGSFKLTNLLYRQSYLDTTIEPHDLPLQFLSETGIVGLVLLLAAFGSLIAAGWRRRGHELALALVVPAYFLHALVDVDWDLVAVTGPALLVGGALVGRPVARRASSFATAAAAGAALAVFACLLLPWLGHRWSDQAQGALTDQHPAQALSLARKARGADPLLVDPVWTQAEAVDDLPTQLAYYEEATRLQPHNPYTWLFLGQFVLEQGCPRRAYPALQRFTDLNDHDRPTVGANDKDRALRYVNSGRPDPRGCGG